jgi:sigma-E factor negative regulatory protein RseA
MKPDISALVDEELEQDAAARTIDALRDDRELQEAWNVYHLIGDILRRAPAGPPDLAEKVMARLAEEPVLFVPAAARKKPGPMRFALPLAAAVMGMAAVGWVALSLNTSPTAELAAKPRQAGEPAVTVADPSPTGGLKEYLVAHQAHAPSGGIPGVAPYVRTVSDIRRGGGQ